MGPLFEIDFFDINGQNLSFVKSYTRAKS